MRIPYAEEYQNNTVSQISWKISHIRKRVFFPPVCERRVWGYERYMLLVISLMWYTTNISSPCHMTAKEGD